MLKRIINTITARREGKIDMTAEINEKWCYRTITFFQLKIL